MQRLILPNTFRSISPPPATHPPYWLRNCVLLALLLIGTVAQASHFRYGSISYRTVGPNTVEFKVQQAWRTTAFFSSTPRIGATTGVTTSLFYGDGTADDIRLTVTAANPVENFFFGEATFTHTYATAADYTAYFDDCCRIAGIENDPVPSGSGFRVEALVRLTGNNSPLLITNPIVNVQQGATATFNLAAADSDGDNLRYRMPLPSEYEGVNIAGQSVTPSGQFTLPIAGAAAGDLYVAIAVVEDLDASGNVKSKVMVDFLVKVVTPSTLPEFDYLVTPADGFAYSVRPGTSVDFDVRAVDSDAGSTVTLNVTGAPAGSTFTPLLPTSGNPVQTNFSWTPLVSDIGTYVLNITATDEGGNQVATSVSIVVSLRPQFDVPPTPVAGVPIVVEPGTAVTYTVQASDDDPADVVSIIEAIDQGSGNDVTTIGATLTPATPTPAANPTSTVFEWTPQLADWGIQRTIYRAEDSFSETATHEVSVLVNTTPVFLSMPPLTAAVGVPYTYTISVEDPDLPFGDVLEIIAPTLPGWLTLTDNGDGTATLAGTPSAADVGVNSVELHAEDTYHHTNVGGSPHQEFDIVVTGDGPTTCTLVLTLSGTTDLACSNDDDGAITVTTSGASGTVTYSLSGAATASSTDGMFTGLPAGTYTVVATDAGVANCTDTLSGIELTASTSGTDTDGDGIPDVCDPDDDNDGFPDGIDCDPLNDRVNPTFMEVCDGIDNNCDGIIDNSPPPVITRVDQPRGALLLGNELIIAASFTDPDDGNGHHRATIDWGDGTVTQAPLNQAANTVKGKYSGYTMPGAYTVTVTVYDACGFSDAKTTTRKVIVYKPGAEYVSGGGWFHSTRGAYRPDKTLHGDAYFGFTASYDEPKDPPSGALVFSLPVAGINFVSTGYHYLFVSDDYAVFAGMGEMMGVGGYRFVATATDGMAGGSGGADSLRIELFDPAGTKVYDNKVNSMGSSRGTELGGGDIDIARTTASHLPGPAPAVTAPSEQPLNVRPEAVTVEVYPNPAATLVNLKLGQRSAETEVSIRDLSGRSVVRQTVAAEVPSLTVDLPAARFPNGVYLITVTTAGERQVTRKLLVQR